MAGCASRCRRPEPASNAEFSVAIRNLLEGENAHDRKRRPHLRKIHRWNSFGGPNRIYGVIRTYEGSTSYALPNQSHAGERMVLRTDVVAGLS